MSHNHPSRLIFGSCNSQLHKEQPLWQVIESRNATAFIWGGDAVYADDRRRPPPGSSNDVEDNNDDHIYDDDQVATEHEVQQNSFISHLFGQRRSNFLSGTPDYLHTLYSQQRLESGYRSLLDTNISIYGTIDDHDYGINNGDKTFRWKRENGIEFVKFLNLPAANSAMLRRAEQGLGVYGVQVYDFNREYGSQWLSEEEAGLDPDVVPILFNDADKNSSTSNRLVAVFVLDVRTNKSPWKNVFPDRFIKSDTTGDFLGDLQWTWFETALSRSTAAVNIIVTGIQIHAERFFDAESVENWSGFPTAQHRLYQTLLQPNVKAPILISGDVHKAQFLRKDCIRQQLQQQSRQQSTSSSSSPSKRLIRPLYEITTSGMTHAWGSAKPSTCGRANTAFCQTYYFQAIFRPIMILAHNWLCPWTELIRDERTGRPQYSIDRNVAELEFDWEQRLVNVTILGIDGVTLVSQSWPIDQLTEISSQSDGSRISPSSLVTDQDFEIAEKRLKHLSILKSRNNDGDEWICVQYQGLPSKLYFGITTTIFVSSVMLLGLLPFILCCFAVRICLRRMMISLSRRRRNRKKKVD